MQNTFFRLPKNFPGVLTAESPAVAGACLIKSECSLGAFSYIGANSAMTQTSIGRYCSLATGIVVGPTDHPTDRFTTHLISFQDKGPFGKSDEFKSIMKGSKLIASPPPTVIGHDVWIGANVVVKRGVTIGSGAIIGAGSVVTKDVAPYEIVGGVPSKRIRMRFRPETCSRLLALEWWLYNLSDVGLTDAEYDDVEKFLDMMEKRKAAGDLTRLRPPTYLFTKDTQSEAPNPLY